MSKPHLDISFETLSTRIFVTRYFRLMRIPNVRYQLPVKDEGSIQVPLYNSKDISYLKNVSNFHVWCYYINAVADDCACEAYPLLKSLKLSFLSGLPRIYQNVFSLFFCVSI